ncbi:MAG: metallophosphatase domain-containing protein [Gemmatimonadaceae bacterium]
MRLVILSDTHGLHGCIPAIPDGDVLIHAGDLAGRGDLTEVAEFFQWYAAQPHAHKIVIAGNHDWGFERQPMLAEGLVPTGVHYLRDSGVTIEGVRFWGSPWQPWFNHFAFNLLRGAEIAAKWALIPDDTKVLITHGPPRGILDVTRGYPTEHVGCEDLLVRIGQLTQLRVHAFGHIHEAYGEEQHGKVRYVNASICTADYAPINAPLILDI